MAKAKDAPETVATTSEKPKGVTKAEAVKQAFAKLGAKAKSAEIKTFAKEQFGLDVSGTYIYMVKSAMGKKPAATKAAAPKVEKPTVKTATPAPKAVVHAGNGKNTGGINLSDIQTIKNLTEQYGASDLQTLITMLAK